jgi:hypothetical protein
MKKKLLEKVPLIKTDYEEERLQPTPAGHPKGKLLSTGLTTILEPIPPAPLYSPVGTSKEALYGRPSVSITISEGIF